jgi:hypothetical protein
VSGGVSVIERWCARVHVSNTGAWAHVAAQFQQHDVSVAAAGGSQRCDLQPLLASSGVRLADVCKCANS